MKENVNKCGSCRYLDHGECHFEPPQVIHVPGLGLHYIRPKVAVDDTACSHHNPKFKDPRNAKKKLD
jgi:hypothetical protein